MNRPESAPSRVMIQKVPSLAWPLFYGGWIFLLMIGVMVGCASRAHLSPDYGQRSLEIRQQQAANPNAPSDKSGPAGLPGTIGENVNKRYADSFKPTAPTTGVSTKSEKMP